MSDTLIGYLSPVQSLAGALSQPPAEGPVITQLTVTENGTYQEDGVAYSHVAVDVQPPLEAKTITPSEQAQTVEPTSPNYGLSRVTVQPIPGEYVVPSGTVQITTNGTHDVSGYATAEVNVPTGGGGNADGIIAGSLVALENATATKIRREFASITKRYNYRNLPSGYTQVEYIQSSGTEYIDTGVIMDTNAAGKTAQMSFMYLTRGVSTVLLGARLDNTNLMAFLSTYYGTPSWAYTNKSGTGANLAQNRVYVLQTELRNGWQAMQIDGAAQTQGTNGGAVTSTLPFFLFARNNNGTADCFVTGRVYDCIVRNGNQNAPKLCDLVPCREEATGKYGMYDLVSNAFKANAGSGDFTGGRDVPNLVYGYTSADFAAVTEIGDYAFYNNDLASLTLRANQVVTLGENALAGTPIASGTGYIYVPSSLVSAYKADSAWSVYSGRITAIS